MIKKIPFLLVVISLYGLSLVAAIMLGSYFSSPVLNVLIGWTFSTLAGAFITYIDYHYY